jgi:superfamily II DNA or RNA helicase
MEKRELILRDYQVPASDFAMEHDKVVLGLAPNGGKTEIAIDVIRRFLQLFPNERVLVLTHSTTVLRSNFYDRIVGINNFAFIPSLTFDTDSRIHICLPHSENKIRGTYGLVIVDEAHENYLEKRVQRVIKKIKPKKQVLLTGTPSKFIAKGGFKIFVIALNEMPSKYFAKLNIELVATKYNWAKNIDANLEVKSNVRDTLSNTKHALGEIVLKLMERLDKIGLTAEQFNHTAQIPERKKASMWGTTFKKIGKTIFACRRVDQATDVFNILKAHKVNCVLSTSKDDIDSSEVTNFKENKYDVLVVVNRARLGYSDDNLFNTIDMTGTHSPNIINQMFSRVLRGGDTLTKLYLKVTTQEYGMMDFTRACVCGALMLTDHKYLSTFNGKNFMGMLIPIVKIPRRNTNRTGEVINKTNKKKPESSFIFPAFTHDVINFFRDVIADMGKPASIYKEISIAEVRNKLRELQGGQVAYDYDHILELARAMKTPT